MGAHLSAPLRPCLPPQDSLSLAEVGSLFGREAAFQARSACVKHLVSGCRVTFGCQTTGHLSGQRADLEGAEWSLELGLEYCAAIVKMKKTGQQKLMRNSHQQFFNIWDAFEIDDDQMLPGPVLLLDDVLNSRWSLTVCGRLLREHGANAVYPYVLPPSGHGYSDLVLPPDNSSINFGRLDPGRPSFLGIDCALIPSLCASCSISRT
jgi:hypothetical protein